MHSICMAHWQRQLQHSRGSAMLLLLLQVLLLLLLPLLLLLLLLLGCIASLNSHV